MHIRKARTEDIETIVRLSNAGGPDGKPRERLPETLPPGYLSAFRRIEADLQNALMVVEIEGQVVGTFHLTYIYYLAGKGSAHLQVEAVHIAEAHRNRGLGTQMMNWIIAEGRKQNCRRIQLTTNKIRTDSHRFYLRLGFVASHEGMKYAL